MKKPSVTTAIFLDTRRSKKGNIYPVKLRVTYKRKSQFYKTEFSLTKSDFKIITTTANPKGELKDVKLALADVESDAKDVIKRLKMFSFDLFKKKYFANAGDDAVLFFHL